MGPRALAFSNNDIAVIAWTYDQKLPNCLGFAIYRIDAATGIETPLPALARFASTPPDAKLTTKDAPIQKFWWKDLGAERGGTYRYRIEPLEGTPGNLSPLPGPAPIVTNDVTLTPTRGIFSAYFNRGIVATQSVVHALGDRADVHLLLRRIQDPTDQLRRDLTGQLFDGVTSLLDRADDHQGHVLAALYELSDPAGLERRLQAADRGDAQSRHVILGNARVTDEKTNTEIDDGDAANRQALKDAGVAVTDRILRDGSIPHNKFMVMQANGQAAAVLTGSTNWTCTGLCTQTNNALVVNSPAVAARYVGYWDALAADVAQAQHDKTKLQGPTLRSFAHVTNDAQIATPIQLEDGSATVEVLVSPNTNHTLLRPPKEKPNDAEHLFGLIKAAKHAILFLVFDPGNNSVLDAAGEALRLNPSLFVRGATTSGERATNFATALLGDKSVAGQHYGEIDYRAIPAGSVGPKDAFGAWETEIHSAGHAIIHDKIVVIDPFTPDCVVVTGSHNLGYRASHNNDENMLIVRGHQPLAEAYACHVLDVYDHYAWRWWLHKDKNVFAKHLVEDDSWQDWYIKGEDEKSPELRFWLAVRAS